MHGPIIQIKAVRSYLLIDPAGTESTAGTR
jgi:hypothetical protein